MSGWDVNSWPSRASFQERELFGLGTPGLPALISSCFGDGNCNMFWSFPCSASLQLLLYPWPPHCSKDAPVSPNWRLWNSQASLGEAVQRRQVRGVSGKGPQHSCVCHFSGTSQCEAAGHKKGLTQEMPGLKEISRTPPIVSLMDFFSSIIKAHL